MFKQSKKKSSFFAIKVYFIFFCPEVKLCKNKMNHVGEARDKGPFTIFLFWPITGSRVSLPYTFRAIHNDPRLIQIFHGNSCQ